MLAQTKLNPVEGRKRELRKTFLHSGTSEGNVRDYSGNLLREEDHHLQAESAGFTVQVSDGPRCSCELRRDCLDSLTMAALAGEKSGAGKEAGEGRLSWPVFLLALAAFTSSSLSALSLHQLVVLRAEVEGLKSEVWRRKEEGQGVRHRGQGENISSRRSSQEYLQQSESRPGFTAIRRRRMVPGPETLVSQSCLQLLPNHNRKMFTKEISSAIYTGLPWQAGLRRGSALEAENDRMLVREEGYYFVYSQVYYRDATFAMGHVVTRWKSHVVGGEHSFVFLFRCIQTMDPDNPYNTCYTGGIVKLDVGDYVELLIPRPSANLSLDGDSTFLGAIKLG